MGSLGGSLIEIQPKSCTRLFFRVLPNFTVLEVEIFFLNDYYCINYLLKTT